MKGLVLPFGRIESAAVESGKWEQNILKMNEPGAYYSIFHVKINDIREVVIAALTEDVDAFGKFWGSGAGDVLRINYLEMPPLQLIQGKMIAGIPLSQIGEPCIFVLNGHCFGGMGYFQKFSRSQDDYGASIMWLTGINDDM